MEHLLKFILFTIYDLLNLFTELNHGALEL